MFVDSLPALVVMLECVGRPRWPGGYRGVAWVGQVVCDSVVLHETAYHHTRHGARLAAQAVAVELDYERRQMTLPVL